MNQNKNKALREGAMMVALTVVLVLVSTYVPFLALIGSFICGVPMAALAARNGFRVSIPSLMVVFLLTVFITQNVFSAISLLLMSVLPGAVAGHMLGRGYPFFTQLFSVCLTVCLGWIFEILVIDSIMGTGIEEMLAEIMNQMRAMTEKMLQGAGQSEAYVDGVSIKEITRQMIATVESLIRTYFPTFVVLMSLAEGYIIMRLCGFVINRTRVAKVKIVPFSMMKATRGMNRVAILGWIYLFFAGSKSPFGVTVANVVAILYTLIGVCGLSFVDYKIGKRIKSALARFGIYVAVFLFGGVFISFVSTVLIFIGIIDSTRDFRGLGAVGE